MARQAIAYSGVGATFVDETATRCAAAASGAFVAETSATGYSLSVAAGSLALTGIAAGLSYQAHSTGKAIHLRDSWS